MGGVNSLTDRLAALEQAAARKAAATVVDMTPEEASRRYYEWKAQPVPADARNPFEGVPPERVVEVYLERIGAGAGRVPKGRG